MIRFITGIFGSGKGEQLRTILSYLLLAVVLIFVLYSLFGGNKNRKQLPIISVLERVKYMEELQLITYYSDEIIEIGTADNLQRSVDKLQQQLDEEKLKLQNKNMDWAGAKAEVRDAVSKVKTSRHVIDSLHARVDSLSSDHEVVAARFHKSVAALSKLSQSTLERKYGTTLADAFQKYQKVSDRGRRRERRAARAALEQALNQAASSYHNRLKEAQDAYKTTRKHQEKQGYDREVKRSQHKARKLQADYEKMRTQYLGTEDKYHVLDSTLQEQYKAEASGFRKPRLLAVVPCKVSTYIDLKAVHTDTTGESVDSIFTINVDSVRMGQPEILLEEAKAYNIAQGGGGSDDAETPYQIVFEQIRNNIPRIEHNLLEKANHSNLHLRSCEQVDHYFQALTSGMGLNVRVVTKNCPK